MNDHMSILCADGRTLDLPVSVREDGAKFCAEQLDPGRDIDITEIRVFSDSLDRPIRFVLESFTISDGECGRWMVTRNEDDLGLPQWDLEYYATKVFGRPARNSVVMQWDHEQECLVGN